MTLAIGLFDNLQIDPTDLRSPHEVLAERLADLAYAESLGFWGVFTGERHFWPAYRSVAPAVWLAAATQHTSRMRLGVLAFTLPLHQPAQFAEEVAFLDHLSGGRLEVGIGLGHRPVELAQTGVDPNTRNALVEERLAIVRALWTGRQVNATSEHHRLHELRLGMTPAQEPHPPMWYAGVDPASATWAAGKGLGLAVGFGPVATLAPAVETYREAWQQHATELAQEARPTEPGGGRVGFMRHVYLAETPGAAQREMADDLYRLQGLDPKVRDGSRAHRREDAEAEVTRLLGEEMYLAGTPEEVAIQLVAARRALGFDLFLGNVYAAGIDGERLRRTMRLLATQAGPLLATATERAQATV